MTYSALNNWKYDKNLYHRVQSGPQRTADDLNITNTYELTSSGYVYQINNSGSYQQTYVALSSEGFDFGTITPGPPNDSKIPEPTSTLYNVISSGDYWENWTQSGILAQCADPGYDNLPSGCYSGTAVSGCPITYPVGPSGELPAGCVVVQVSGIVSSGYIWDFEINENVEPRLNVTKGNTYIFDQSDVSNYNNQILFSTTPDGYHTVTNIGYWVGSGILSGCTFSGYNDLPSGCYTGFWVASGILSGCASSGYNDLPSGCYSGTSMVGCPIEYPVGSGGALPSGCVVVQVSGFIDTSQSSCPITYPRGISGALPSGCEVAQVSGFVDVFISGQVYDDGITVSGTPGTPGAKIYFTPPNDAPSTLFYFGQAYSGMGNQTNVADRLEVRDWYYSTDWREVPPVISGYWTNYLSSFARISGALTIYNGFRRQGFISTANSTVQTAFGPEPGLQDRGAYVWYGTSVPDNQFYEPFETPQGNTAADGITGGSNSYPIGRSPTLTNPTKDDSGSRAAWVYNYPVYCQTWSEAVRSDVPGQMGTVQRFMYRGKSSRYVPNFGSTYGVLGEGIRGTIRTFSPGTNL